MTQPQLARRLGVFDATMIVMGGIVGASIEDSRQKLEYDLYYAKNYSPFLDLLILLQTIRVVIWPEGAR